MQIYKQFLKKYCSGKEKGNRSRKNVTKAKKAHFIPKLCNQILFIECRVAQKPFLGSCNNFTFSQYPGTPSYHRFQITQTADMFLSSIFPFMTTILFTKRYISPSNRKKKKTLQKVNQKTNIFASVA